MLFNANLNEMKNLALVVLILVLYSCANEKNQSVATVDVELSSAPELKNLSELATDIRYIPLETNPNSVMKFVNYLKVSDDKFYINTVLELLCFDKSGRFLYKLDQQGRGPKEYVYLSDFDINPGKNQVMVLTRGKLFFYNETDTGFRFSRQLDLKVQPSYCDFIPNEDNILLSFATASGENLYQCVGISPEGDTLFKRPNHNKFTRVSKVQMGFSIDNVINKSGDLMRVKNFLSDTMYTLSKDYKFTPFMILNTGGKGITPEFLANVPLPDNSGSNPMARFLMLSEILEVDRYLLHRHYFQGAGSWGVYDKELGESSMFDSKKLLKDDIAGGINIDPKFASNGMLYSWTDALTFKTFMSANSTGTEELKNPERAAELKQLAASIKEDDNHILIAITPKK